MAPSLCGCKICTGVIKFSVFGTPAPAVNSRLPPSRFGCAPDSGNVFRTHQLCIIHSFIHTRASELVAWELFRWRSPQVISGRRLDLSQLDQCAAARSSLRKLRAVIINHKQNCQPSTAHKQKRKSGFLHAIIHMLYKLRVGNEHLRKMGANNGCRARLFRADPTQPAFLGYSVQLRPRLCGKSL